MCHHTLSSNFISKNYVIWNFAVMMQKKELGEKSAVLEQWHPSPPYTWQPVVSFSYDPA